MRRFFAFWNVALCVAVLGLMVACDKEKDGKDKNGVGDPMDGCMVCEV